MKKLSVLLLLLLSACSPISKIESEIDFRGIDLRKYAEKNFLFDMENYSDPHLVLGIINVKVFAAGEVNLNEYKQNVMNFDESQINIDGVLEKIYLKALEYDGDAFVNMKIDRVTKAVQQYSVPGIQITGYIIKRLPVSK